MAAVDLTEFKELTTPNKRGKLARAIEKLSPEEQAQIHAALAQDNDEISCQAIAKWLERRGHQVHSNSVLSYRRDSK